MIQQNASRRMTDVQMARNIVNTGNKQLNQHVFSALKKKYPVAFVVSFFMKQSFEVYIAFEYDGLLYF